MGKPSNRVVFKYPLIAGDVSGDPIKLEMPVDAEILTFQMQWGIPCIWALVDPRQRTVKRRFWVLGTGHALPHTDLTYVGTVQDERFVWHLFEENF